MVWAVCIVPTMPIHGIVLNALRHQWFGQDIRLHPTIGFQVCAQRLTASMVWAEAHDCHGLVLIARAQRLTASMVWAGRFRDRSIATILVLNALRHQWFGQPASKL